MTLSLVAVICNFARNDTYNYLSFKSIKSNCTISKYQQIYEEHLNKKCTHLHICNYYVIVSCYTTEFNIVRLIFASICRAVLTKVMTFGST